MPSRILSSTAVKVVKGESRDKRKTKFSRLAMPSRILSSTAIKVVKGESRDKRKTKFSRLAMPSRILSSTAVKDSTSTLKFNKFKDTDKNRKLNKQYW